MKKLILVIALLGFSVPSLANITKSKPKGESRIATDFLSKFDCEVAIYDLTHPDDRKIVLQEKISAKDFDYNHQLRYIEEARGVDDRYTIVISQKESGAFSLSATYEEVGPFYNLSATADSGLHDEFYDVTLKANLGVGIRAVWLGCSAKDGVRVR